jgi:membrane protein YdbS with pleckstrin-like domain
MAILRKVLPLEKRKILKKSIAPFALRSMVAIPAFLVVFWVVDIVAQGNGASAIAMQAKQGQILIALLLLLGGWALAPMIYETLYYLNYYYDIDDKNLIIRKGVIVKREAILPFSKITDVYVDQDGLDVACAIYDVHISTPTAVSGEFAHIDGVSRKNAMILRDMILERINSDLNNGGERDRTSPERNPEKNRA